MEPDTPGTITTDLLCARNGDIPAFQRLFQRYQPVLERRVTRQLGRRGTDLEAPHELAAQVFTALAQYITSDKTWPMTVFDRDTLEAMMFRVLLCRMVSALRHDAAERRRGTVRDQDVDLPEGVNLLDAHPSREADPADDALAVDLVREMKAVVERDFPAGVPVLADLVAGFSQSEIARRRGFSTTKVNRMMDRIRTLLRPWADAGDPPVEDDRPATEARR